jgi:hypothetical protein
MVGEIGIGIASCIAIAIGIATGTGNYLEDGVTDRNP